VWYHLYDVAFTPTEHQQELINRINALKKEKDAIVLCHNYQRPEVYEVADYIGDSLALCQEAAGINARLIVFSGVYFMAESAALLNPHSTVLVPDRQAGCALSDMITAKALHEWKKDYPDAAVVCYVNSTAAVKAESDICCTSRNAVDIARALPHKQLLFVPDKNLAAFVAKQLPEKEIIPWQGYCPIHERLSPEYLLKAKEMHPNAEIIAHPECTPEVQAVADHVVSTSGMMKVARESSATEFICTTECGMIQRLKKELPHKSFFTVCSVCFDMKKNTLEKILSSLENEEFVVEVPEEVRPGAQLAFDRMFDLMAATDDEDRARRARKSFGVSSE